MEQNLRPPAREGDVEADLEHGHTTSAAIFPTPLLRAQTTPQRQYSDRNPKPSRPYTITRFLDARPDPRGRGAKERGTRSAHGGKCKHTCYGGGAPGVGRGPYHICRYRENDCILFKIEMHIFIVYV